MLDNDALSYSVLHSAVSMLRVAWIDFDQFGLVFFYSQYFKWELKNKIGVGLGKIKKKKKKRGELFKLNEEQMFNIFKK